MVSTSLLIVILVSTIVAGLLGVVLGDVLDSLLVAILAGFFGVISAALIRNFVISRLVDPKRDNGGIPPMIIVFSAVASLAGSMTAQEITRELVHLRPSLMAALAGTISAVLMGMLMVVHHTSTDHRTHRRF